MEQPIYKETEGMRGGWSAKKIEQSIEHENEDRMITFSLYLFLK